MQTRNEVTVIETNANEGQRDEDVGQNRRKNPQQEGGSEESTNVESDN